ncbi:DUF397 domain-containing protein [Actinomadura bangladeshensis]|uniref:DUF397 domain-containing protein n=1 Tax=Actinomadura bangladeshensis TaxID=453573 RepID=A0A4R4NV19_9ACTN|nr:DUF397 domain-containing protein [Actinomadura bangladeshensis]TDC11867.1 DUF397 domain-containing protein [Actinomadura bangladeshensis]
MSFHATPPGQWRRSTRCGASNGCVEVARLDGDAVSVRDTEDVSARLAFDLAEWRAFTRAAKAGRFDRA